MSDEEKPPRPNANYRLSKEKFDPENITYHYNRERRLAKAPQSVRDLYKETPRRRFGVFRGLTDTKSKRFMFVTIIVLCLLIVALQYLGVTGSQSELEGNHLAVEAIKFDDMVIIAVNKTVNKKLLARLVAPYTGAVDIAVLPAGDNSQENVFYHRIFFTFETEEFYRFSVPFDKGELSVVFQTEKKQLVLTVKPE